MARKKMVMKGPPRRWLNTAEAALFLGLSRKALYERARLRQVPFSKLGASLRFDVHELDRLLERSRVKPRTERDR